MLSMGCFGTWRGPRQMRWYIAVSAVGVMAFVVSIRLTKRLGSTLQSCPYQLELNVLVPETTTPDYGKLQGR